MWNTIYNFDLRPIRFNTCVLIWWLYCAMASSTLSHQCFCLFEAFLRTTKAWSRPEHQQEMCSMSNNCTINPSKFRHWENIAQALAEVKCWLTAPEVIDWDSFAHGTSLTSLDLKYGIHCSKINIVSWSMLYLTSCIEVYVGYSVKHPFLF